MSRKTKKLLTVLLCVVLSIATIGLAVKVSKLETTKELGTSAYTVGTLNKTDGGKEEKSDYALRTDYLESAKFDKIIIGKDAKITYTIFYYDGDKNYLAPTDDLSVDFTEMPTEHPTLGSTIKYFRIVINIPESEKKVSILNKGDYVKQLTVTMKK